ncbi:MAG TPA: tetratricopeptide repeat protein, partial [Candidatus Nitrosotalea sp.]|nr:tetratricopeptide repeat protein [Candidatus Nitrosotalea sp.]
MSIPNDDILNISSNPKNKARIFHKKALEFQKVGKHDEAIEYFDKALEFEPNNAELLYDKAISFQMLLRFDNAIECY